MFAYSLRRKHCPLCVYRVELLGGEGEGEDEGEGVVVLCTVQERQKHDICAGIGLSPQAQISRRKAELWTSTSTIDPICTWTNINLYVVLGIH